MKTILFMLAFGLTSALAQPDPQPIVDSTSTGQVTVVSDTTDTDSMAFVDTPMDNNDSNGSDCEGDLLDNIGAQDALWGVTAATGGVLLACLVLFLVFGLPILLVVLILVLVFRSRNKENRMRYEMAQAYLKKGEKVPDALIKQPETADSDLYEKGIKTVCLGIGITIFFYFLFESMAFASIGLIILLQGVGQLLINRKRKDNNGTTE